LESMFGPAGSGGGPWSTESLLECEDISGEEITRFCGVSIDERRQMYVAWKRRDLEASLAPSERVCERCRVIYTVYANDWNRRGFCSRSCEGAASKSKHISR
jgi:hypothetical protein